MELQIYRPELDDLDDLSILFDRYRVFYKQKSDLLGAKEFIGERIRNEDSYIFLARNNDGVAVGFSQLYPSFSSQSIQRMWILNDLYIEKSFRRHGIAQALLSSAQDLAIKSGSKGLLLCTQTTNVNAQALYEKVGFVELADYKWFFQEAKHA